MLVAAARGGLRNLGLLSPEWPNWAVDTFISLSLCCAALVAGQWMYDRRRAPAGEEPPPPSADGDDGGNEVVLETSATTRFRR